jgi:hypothetical protein
MIAERDQITENATRFAEAVSEHRMTTLSEDGLYRHLRFNKPGSWSYGFDLVTWPGYLAITGDMGDYVFARTADMFEFFETDRGRINPQYWSEKLANKDERKGTLVYDQELFKPRVMEWYADRVEYAGLTAAEEAALLDALREQVFERTWDADGPYSREEAIRLLMEFSHDGVAIDEPYDWSLERWDWQFLWCCHAIVWGIARYREEASRV